MCASVHIATALVFGYGNFQPRKIQSNFKEITQC